MYIHVKVNITARGHLAPRLGRHSPGLRGGGRGNAWIS